MRFLIAAGVMAGLSCAFGALADPSDPLAAANPANTSGWRPPPPATSGLKRYQPVGVEDWIELNRRAGSQDMPSKDDMPSMDGMPGMGGDK